MNVRRYAVLTGGELVTSAAKTAHGLLRYGRDEVVAVIDPAHRGRLSDILPDLQRDVPVVATLDEALALQPTSLLLGTAPQGGALPEEWKPLIFMAIAAKLEIVSGLHDLLRDDPQIVRAAREAGTTLWDVRISPRVPLFSGASYGVVPPVLLTVGTDCAVGKMRAALELTAASQRQGLRARFVATGQTGILIARSGICIDRVVADFAAGAAEQLVVDAAGGADLLVVEGQGAINHPAYAQVTTALLYGCAPDALVLVAVPGQREIEPYGTPVLSYREAIAAYEASCALVKPAPVAGVALNTAHLSEDDARREIAHARAASHLPADDLVRFGAGAFYDAIAPQLTKRRPVRLEVAL